MLGQDYRRTRTISD